MTMSHPGLPVFWAVAVCLCVALLSGWALWAAPPSKMPNRRFNLSNVALLGYWIRAFTTRPWPLLILKGGMTALFILVIIAGLFGTPIPERNLATMLTWNIWWTGLIISIFFLGSAWCAVCPWNALANWLVRRRLWRRAQPNNSLNLRVPKAIRNVLPALLLLIGLTWLELGAGITTDPYATALLALAMVVLATVSLSLFERNAFCRYFCPVGRTVGFYSQLAPVELRPIDTKVCADCTTLDCYHGNASTEPCPTHLVMGRLKQNTYCTSCCNCTRSCPQQNIAWRLRPQSVEAIQDARPHWDEAWFMLALLALTGFHGITMMSFWEHWLGALTDRLGDSGQWSFSVGLALSLIIPIAFYALVIGLSQRLSGIPYKRLFTGLAFVALPLAFAYHLAHNLNHLVREGDGLGALFANPLGLDAQPLSMMEKHARHLDLLISEHALFALQAGLMVFGFWLALRVIRHRGYALLATSQGFIRWPLLPILLFALVMTGLHLYLLMQPMLMRM